MILARLLIASSLLFMQVPHVDTPVDPDTPPVEPPVTTPACHNYHDNAEQNCHCKVAIEGEGSESSRPDPEKGEDWCKTYCIHKCLCIKPTKTLMPQGRLRR